MVADLKKQRYVALHKLRVPETFTSEMNMTRFLAAIAVAAFATVAPAANAEEYTLTKPMTGITLHDGGVDMSVYFESKADGMEVVGTYVAQRPNETPSRIRMLLQDGEGTAFALPEGLQAYYTFERQGDALKVSSSAMWTRIAKN